MCIELRAVPVPIAQVVSLLLDVVGCPISNKSIIVAMVPKSWPAMQSGQFLAFTTEMQHLMEVTHRAPALPSPPWHPSPSAVVQRSTPRRKMQLQLSAFQA